MKVLSTKVASSFGVRPVCKLLGITPQDYYKTNWTRKQTDEASKNSLIEYVRNARDENPGIGAKKVIYMYNQEIDKKDHIGRDKALKWLAEEGLINSAKKAYKPRTTDSDHDLQTYENLTESLVASRFGEVIASDITYVKLTGAPKKHCYLSLTMDDYSRMIVGWAVGNTLETKHTMKAIKMAAGELESRKVNLRLTIHHSDCGVQYCSNEYTGYLKKKGIAISMAKGDPRKNAKAERLNGIVKNELLKGKKFKSTKALKKAIAKAAKVYNEKRPHLSLGLMTPKQVADGVKTPMMMWHSYRTAAIKRNKEKILVEFVQSVLWPAARQDYLQSGTPLKYCGDWSKSVVNSMPRFTTGKRRDKCGIAITPSMAGLVYQGGTN